MVSKPIIPEETLEQVRDAVHANKKLKKGPQTIKAFINEAVLAKLDSDNITPEVVPLEREENMG